MTAWPHVLKFLVVNGSCISKDLRAVHVFSLRIAQLSILHAKLAYLEKRIVQLKVKYLLGQVPGK